MLAVGDTVSAFRAAQAAQCLLPAGSDAWQMVHRLQLEQGKPIQQQSQQPCTADALHRGARSNAARAQHLAALVVRQLPGEGRALCVTQAVEPGTDLLSERPYSITLAKGWANKVMVLPVALWPVIVERAVRAASAGSL